MSMSSEESPPRPGFRGWRVVPGAFITSMAGFGAAGTHAGFSAILASTFHAWSNSTRIISSLSTGAAFVSEDDQR
jgi:hypothetical protein